MTSIRIVLYRPRLDLRSGTGQLMRAQADGLEQAGEQVTLAGARGALKFSLRVGRRARRLTPERAVALAERKADLVVDHGLAVPNAKLVFVHNLLCEGLRYLERDDWRQGLIHEQSFFARLDAATPVIANSELVKRALEGHYAVDAERVLVHYPGYDPLRFNSERTARLRREARANLGIDEQTPLVGFVTSGDFAKRGLDGFLEVAARMVEARPELRCLVVGSKKLPAHAATHPVVASGRLLYRAKTARPELFMAALDVFVYAACFEEFGLVISEAQALGVPVLTSRRVGAAECLPPEYAPWLLATPDPERLAAQALALLDDKTAHRALSLAAQRSITRFASDRYVAESVAVIRAQKPRLK